MTREQCLEILKEDKSSITLDNLIRVLIFYKSPVTQEVEYRVGYFEQSMEAILWEDKISSFYENHHISYVTYIDDRIYKSQGCLF